MRGYRIKKVKREKLFLAIWRINGKDKSKAFDSRKNAQKFLDDLASKKNRSRQTSFIESKAKAGITKVCRRHYEKNLNRMASNFGNDMEL